MAGLLLDRKVFLLDEITSALDADLKEYIVNLFAGRPDWTVIVVSHDPVWKKNLTFTPVPIGEQ